MTPTVSPHGPTLARSISGRAPHWHRTEPMPVVVGCLGGSVAISAAGDLAHGFMERAAGHLDVRFVTACNGLVTAL